MAKRYEKVSRKVLVSRRSKVHDGVDFAPSICVGLYVDKTLKAPPVIEMAFLNNRYGVQAAMHFQKIIPQILPTPPKHQPRPSVLDTAKGLLSGRPRQGSGGAFADYVATEQVRLRATVRSSVHTMASNALAANLRQMVKFNDPTPGGSSPPSNKPESAGEAATSASDSVTFTNFGLIADLLEGNVSAAIAKMAIETGSALKNLVDQAVLHQNPVAIEVWEYVQGRAEELASRVAHPKDVAKLSQDVSAYMQEMQYLSLNLMDVEILTIDVSKPSSDITDNAYNFDHEIEVMGLFWRVSPSGEAVPRGYLPYRDIENEGFVAGAAEFREYQAMMPPDSREFILKGDIPAEHTPAPRDGRISNKPAPQVKSHNPGPRGP